MPDSRRNESTPIELPKLYLPRNEMVSVSVRVSFREQCRVRTKQLKSDPLFGTRCRVRDLSVESESDFGFALSRGETCWSVPPVAKSFPALFKHIEVALRRGSSEGVRVDK